MKCNKMKLLIHASLDRELESGREADVRRHLAECAACRMYRERMAECRDLAQSMPRPDAPPALFYLVNARLGYASGLLESNWFSTLQFRMLDFHPLESLRAAFLAVPIAALFFIVIAILVFSPRGLENIQRIMDPSRGNYFEENLVQRQYLENFFEFSPEALSARDIYQPRISTVPVKMFMENDFQKSQANHLGVLTRVRPDGSTEVESISGGDPNVAQKILTMFESSIVLPAIAGGKVIDSKVLFTFEKVEVKG
jgi:hypothetical protein